MATRITIVGGGSSHWTPRILVDLANTPSLMDAEVVLMDINSHSLPPVIRLADHIAKCRSIGLRASATTDLDAALDGAEFVITAFSVGGFDSMRHDIEIPTRYGIRQPIGDSIGPGGIMRALRSIPVLLDIALAMEKRCPDALLLNVTNPLSALTRAVSSETNVKVVGLCNEVIGLMFVLSLLFDCRVDRVDPVIGGVNHLPLATAVRIGGRDGLAMLAELLEKPAELSEADVWIAPPEAMHYRKVTPGTRWTKADVVANNRIKLEMFKLFGVLPGSADSHVAEFLPGFVTEASDFGRDWGIHLYGMAGHQEEKTEDDRNLASLIASDEIPSWPSGELPVPVIDGVLTGDGRHLPVNLPNTGQVENLPVGQIVECIGIIGTNGIKPRDRVKVSSVLGEFLRRVALSEELTVEAAIYGERTKVLEAMLTDPMAGRLPFERAVTMTDEMLAATSAWLPQFSPAPSSPNNSASAELSSA